MFNIKFFTYKSMFLIYNNFQLLLLNPRWSQALGLDLTYFILDLYFNIICILYHIQLSHEMQNTN